MPFDEGYRLQTYDHKFESLMPTSERDHHRLCATRTGPIEDKTTYLLDMQSEWRTNPFCDYHVGGAEHVANMHTPHNLILWNPSNPQPVSELHPITCSSIALNEDCRNSVSSNFRSTCDLGWNAAHDFTIYPGRTPCPTLPERQPLIPLLEQHSGVLWDLSQDQSMAYPPIARSSGSTETYPQCANTTKDENTAKPFISHPPTALSNLFQTSNEYPQKVPPSPSFCRIVHPGSSPRRRAARAIWYNELWIDEDELLKGLTQVVGKLNLHQCLWDLEDQSSCYLWITGDKSCINRHIQKWHGGKPGGEKTLVKCRWSSCGKTMRKESISRHIISIHMDEVWECQGCGKQIARNDAYGRHAAKSDSEECRTSGALITYSSDARVVDARTALDSGGRVRYASESMELC